MPRLGIYYSTTTTMKNKTFYKINTNSDALNEALTRDDVRVFDTYEAAEAHAEICVSVDAEDERETEALTYDIEEITAEEAEEFGIMLSVDDMSAVRAYAADNPCPEIR